MLRSFVARACIALVVISFPAAASAQLDEDWPQFRGHKVDGIATAREVFADGQTPNLATSWKQPLGSGYSGVSIAGGLAVTMFTDGESNILIGFDANTGHERWRFPFSPVYKGHDGSYDGPISTPVIHGNFTIALGPSGRFFALDNLDGELVWSTDLVEELGASVPLYGFASSPMMMEGLAILQIGAEGGTVAAFDPQTGERRWQLGGDGVHAQTPIPVTLNGRAQMLAGGNTTLMGIEPSSGELLWSFEHGGKDMIGAWTMVPVAAGADRFFLNYKDASSTVVELSGSGDELSPRELWEARTIRNTYAVAVYHEGHVYGLSSRFLTCVDVATGKAVWKSRPPGDGFLILVDGHLVILTKDGSVHVVKASTEGYQEIASRQIFDALAWTPPSFADGSLFVRSLGAIARIEMYGDTLTTDAALPAEAKDIPDESGFARFLAKVQEADDKEKVIDAFFDKQSSFPIVENNRFVHFVYRGDAEDVAIAGDMIGARQERPMSRVEGTNLFHYSTELRSDARVSYLFVKDFQENLTDPHNPVTVQWAIFGEDMRVGGTPVDVSSLAMPNWKEPAHLAPVPESTPRGSIVSHQMESESMGRSHELEVYLPAGYDAGEARYPVVYVHGARHAVELGRLTDTLDNLIGESLEPMIVVLIEIEAGSIWNSREAYGEMWANEIVPFVDEHYPTIASREARANTGAALGAHDAAHCAFRYPELSARLAIQSLRMIDFGWNPLKPLITTPAEHALKVHVEWGAYDLRNPQEAWDMRERTRGFAAFLEGRGYEVETFEASEGAGWPAWRNRSHAVLQSLFPRSGTQPFH